MRIFLAGGESRHWVHEASPIKENEVNNENISCRCSSVEGGQDRIYDKATAKHKPYILESFYYTDEDTERLLPLFGDFLLDSGAFTFCGTGGFEEHKFEEYLERYAAFINKNRIDKFFELDVL